MNIKIKHRITGIVLFEYDCDYNTVKKTVLKAIESSANLSYADISYADLSSANLSSANLSYADLSSANLRYADLSSANLRYADLSSANLRSTNLRSTNLSSANLSYADLRSTNLRYANLSSANLSYADLSSANLRSTNLRYTNLRYTNLSSANLSSALNSEYSIAVTRIVSEGDIIGWKKCRDSILVKLLIPKEAKRNNATGRKCRAEYADVVEIFGATQAISQHDPSVIYEVGKRVTPTTPYDEDFLNECSSGIHFFITRLEAEKY